MLQDWLSRSPWLTQEFSGLTVWLWLAIPVIFLSSYLVLQTLVSLVMTLLQHLNPPNGRFARYIAPLSVPITLLLTGMAFNAAQQLLPLTDEVVANLAALNALIYTYAVTRALMILGHNALEALRGRLLQQGKTGAAAILPLLRKIYKTSMVGIALVFLLQNWGFDVAALIAALGVGGIAIALAAQKTVENLFGGLTLSLDQPIRVGDFGKFGDTVGTVEDIGLRSTRIRTLERTILCIPNSVLSGMSIVNFAPRDKILLKHLIGLRYETTADQMRYVITQLKELLISHPMIENAPARPRFIGFGDYSLNIELFAYVRTADFDRFLEVQEDILLRIKEIITVAGTDFAFPSQTLYMERGERLDEKTQQRIQRKLQNERRNKQLQWPQLTPQRVEELTDSLPYPLPESAIANT